MNWQVVSISHLISLRSLTSRLLHRIRHVEMANFRLSVRLSSGSRGVSFLCFSKSEMVGISRVIGFNPSSELEGGSIFVKSGVMFQTVKVV
jgi:hypothetical protein